MQVLAWDRQKMWRNLTQTSEIPPFLFDYWTFIDSYKPTIKHLHIFLSIHKDHILLQNVP